MGIPSDEKRKKIFFFFSRVAILRNACQMPNSVKEFSVHSGWIVDAISVDGKKYGKNSSEFLRKFFGSTKKIKLAPGEKITKVKYALMFDYFMCQLVFYSNMNKKYGPYGSANYGYYETDYYEVNNP